MRDIQATADGLRSAIERSGYYPGLVADAVSSALGSEDVVSFARSCGVRRLALFHHDPLHDDPTVRAIAQAAQAELDGAVEDVSAAREGESVELSG